MTQARIFQINASNGGVPKRPIRHAAVNELGITIDKQKHTKIHGGPDRALCLYSLARIQALQIGSFKVGDVVELKTLGDPFRE